ncbi:MAG: adenylate/guanylate cyclase domain-containing protein [Verrucomicrobiota bacterium]
MKQMLTLRTILTVISLSVLSITVGGVLLVSFFNTRATVQQMALELMEQQSEAVQDKISTYLGPGVQLIEFLNRAVLNTSDDLKNWQQTGSELVPLAELFPQFSWIYYADHATGDLIGVNRTEGENVLHRSFFDESGRRIVDEHVLEGRTWVPFVRSDTSVSSEGYDPRERPWYQAAVASQEPVWTRPYLFFQQVTQGITVAWAHRNTQGELLGVYAIDVMLEDLKEFLGEIQAGENSVAMIFYGDGEVMVEPRENRMAKNARSMLQKARAPMARNPESLLSGGGITTEFYLHNTWYFARVSKLGGAGVPEGYLAVVVPAFDIIEIARDNALISTVVAIVLVGISIFISIRFARIISAPLSQVSVDMARIAKYDISIEPYASSYIYEMAVVTGALEKMKASLRAFGRYVPSDLVKTALESGQEAEVGGKTQELSVMFADLAGFTSISENLSPDEVFSELSSCLQVLTSVPEKHGGAMLTFLGDGVLAVFNAPAQLPHHPEIACRAALEITECLDQLNQSRASEKKPAFKVRIGINSGEVLVGNVGIKKRFSYTVLGDAVNLASRLEGLNKIYGTQILAGEQCYRKTQRMYEWRCVDLISVVGREQSEQIYEPLGPTGRVAAELLQARDTYHQAWQLYLHREFLQAARMFDLAQQQRPADLAAGVMQLRCTRLDAEPPDDSWDGSYLAMSK